MDAPLEAAIHQIELFGRIRDVQNWLVAHPKPTRDEVMTFAKQVCLDLAENPRRCS